MNMVAQRPYITYNLPASRVTQALIGRKIEKVWKNTEKFLTACTTADIENPKSIHMVGYTADEAHGEHPESAEKVLAKVRRVFGEGKTEPVGYLYPANRPLKQTKTEWTLTKKDLPKAIHHLINEQPLPKFNLSPIELIISYNFNLIDFATKEKLPNQQYTSSLLIWLTKNSCVSPGLCFPFTEPNQEFWNYVNSIQPFIPFKFDIKHLRLSRSNKKGTANIFLKL